MSNKFKIGDIIQVRKGTNSYFVIDVIINEYCYVLISTDLNDINGKPITSFRDIVYVDRFYELETDIFRGAI